MGFVGPILFFLAANATIVLLSGRSFGKCMPLAMMVCCLAIFLSGMVFGSFAPGLLVCYLVALAFPIALAGLALRQAFQTPPPPLR